MEPGKQIIEAVQNFHAPRHLANLVAIRGTAHEHGIEDYRASNDVEKLDDLTRRDAVPHPARKLGRIPF